MVRKTRSRGWILALVLVASLAALSAVSGCAGSGGTPLKYQLEAGQSHTYDMSMTLAGSASGPGLPAEEGLIPADTSIKARMTMSVLEVNDGIATILYHYENGEATSQGEIESIPAGSLPDTTVKMDQQGRVLSVESGGQTLPLGMGGTLDYSQIANLTGVIFPMMAWQSLVTNGTPPSSSPSLGYLKRSAPRAKASWSLSQRRGATRSRRWTSPLTYRSTSLWISRPS